MAPALPAVLFYLWGVLKGYGDAAVAGPGLLLPFGYVGALVIGLPTYLVLQRRGSHGLGAYLALGALIGVVVVAVLSTAEALLSGKVRISRMSVLKFTTCQANISCDVGPSFHGMSVQVDAGRRIVSESSFGVNGCRG